MYVLCANCSHHILTLDQKTNHKYVRGFHLIYFQNAIASSLAEYMPADEEELPAPHGKSRANKHPFYRTHPEILQEQRNKAAKGEVPSKIHEDTYRPEHGTTLSSRQVFHLTFLKILFSYEIEINSVSNRW